MLLEEIKQLYPTVKISTYPFSATTYYSLAWENSWLNFAKDNVSAREFELLKLLVRQQKPAKLTAWQAYLLKLDSQLPIAEGTIRFIFYQVKKLDDFTLLEWSEAFKTMFATSILANVILDETSGVLVEKQSQHHYQVQDFEAILATLTTDFQVPAWIYVGDFSVVNETNNLWEIFDEERRLFQVSSKKGVNTLATNALRYLSQTKTKQSLLLQRLKKQIEQQKSLKEMIIALYQAQGNISSAAKKLYVHRNTLQYQIEKFEKESGFNLRNIDDLVLCYLVVL